MKTEKNQIDILSEYVPPSSIASEQSVLGGMLIASGAVERGLSILTAEDFYRNAHQFIFTAVKNLYERNVPVDLITLQEELKQQGNFEAAGGISYLTALFDAVPTAANIEYYCGIVLDKSHRRKLIDTARCAMSAAHSEETLSQIIDNTQSAIIAIEASKAGSGLQHISDTVKEVSLQAEYQSDNPGIPIGTPTNYTEYDMLTGGLQNTDLIIVAARPSMGKTAFALGIVDYVGVALQKTVALFTQEMSKQQVTLRMVSSAAMVNSHKYRNGLLEPEEWERITQSSKAFYNAPIFIDERSCVSVADIRSECRRLQVQHGLSLVVVDYLQLMRGNERTENRAQVIAEIARGLKQIAKDFKVPVIALSQLSRAVEQRENKRPILSDLRESGSIEAEADLVAFLYRESYYREKVAETEGYTPRKPSHDHTEVLIRKARNGPTGWFNLGWSPELAQFSNILPDYLKSGKNGGTPYNAPGQQE